MIVQLTFAQQTRLVQEASNWGRSFTSSVVGTDNTIMDQNDCTIVEQYVLDVDYVGTFVSVREGSLGVGSEYIQFFCVHDSENNPRFFLNTNGA